MKLLPRLALVLILVLSMAALATAATVGRALVGAEPPRRPEVPGKPESPGQGETPSTPPPKEQHPGNGHDRPLPPQAGNGSANERVTAFLTQGYQAGDVHTALNLEGRTGIDALQFLQERKKGADWPQIIEQLVQDKRALERVRPKSVEVDTVDRETLIFYQDQGYTVLDVYEAASIALNYDWDLAEVFSYKTPDLTWYQVEVALEMRDNPVPKDGRMDLSFGEEKRETTITGLHKNDIYRLMDDGYSLEEILTADDLTRQVEASLHEILRLRRQGQDWNTIRQELPHKDLVISDHELTIATGLDAQTLTALRKQGYSPSDLLKANRIGQDRGEPLTAVLNRLEKAGRDWQKVAPPQGPRIADLARTMNMPEQRVEALLKHGATWQEVLLANERAQKRGKPAEMELEALIEQRGQRRTQIDFLYELLPDGTPVEIEHTRSGLTLEDVNHLLPEFYPGEIEMADHLAAELGRSAYEILDALRQGLDWDEIRQRFSTNATEPNSTEAMSETAPEQGGEQ